MRRASVFHNTIGDVRPQRNLSTSTFALYCRAPYLDLIRRIVDIIIIYAVSIPWWKIISRHFVWAAPPAEPRNSLTKIRSQYWAQSTILSACIVCSVHVHVSYLKVIPNLIYCKNLISVITWDKIDLTPWPCYILRKLLKANFPFW